MQGSGSYASRRQVSPGTRLNGIYEVDQLVAAGGMGEIYKGHTIQTGDTVAIKMMLPDLA
jgi:serine/threonine-protein kinase